MRDFFRQELNTLYAKTQLRQYETLSAMQDAEFQIKTLLDALERVCNAFSYIPKEAQKAIILDRMLADDDFIGFNAKIVSKWFNQSKDKYFKEEAHKQGNESNAVPVTYDQLKPETKQLVDELLNSLSLAMKVPKLTAEQIQEEGQEQLTPRATVGHIPTETDLQVLRRAEIIERLGYNKLSPKEVKDMEMFTIGTHEIRARNREEAEQIALAVYE